MLNRKPALTRQMENGEWTGNYRCSECGELFEPITGDPVANGVFGRHVKDKHTGEDFSQAAARIVREATEKH